MKRVMIMGSGAQGSAAAALLEKEADVSEIICADHDIKAAKTLAEGLSKARAEAVNANETEEIVRAGKGADLILNGLPISFNLKVMEAALRLQADYQDLCMTEIGGMDVVESTRYMFSEMNSRFHEKGILALTNTGSAPGLANVVVREVTEKFDSVDTIEMNVYEGIWSERFIPFWWSPAVAFSDMSENPVRYINGKHVYTRPFDNPVMMKFPGIDKPVRMVDHSHEEPVTMGLNAGKYLKGAKNIIFRYGGPHIELSEALYRMGFLSHEKRTYRGFEYVPFDLVIDHAPPAPKYRDEIKNIIDGGLVTEEGAFQIIVEGMRNGKSQRITVYVNSPGLVEAYEKAGISHEAYLTGQSAFIFTKMILCGKAGRKGLISPEVLDSDSRRFFFDEAEKLDITFDEIIESRIN